MKSTIFFNTFLQNYTFICTFTGDFALTTGINMIKHVSLFTKNLI